VILEDLFNDINKKKIKYFIYKGKSHLKEDINLKRNEGDIDVFVPKEHNSKFLTVLFKHGYTKINNSNNSFYKCWENNKVSKIEVVSQIYLGKEPHKPYYLDIDYDKVLIEKLYNINTLSDIDYFPLQFLIRILSNRDKTHSINEITNYYTTYSIKERGYISSLIQKKLNIDESFIKEVVSKKNWTQNKNDLKKLLTRKLKSNKSKLVKSYLGLKLYKYVNYLKIFIKKNPGCFIVFQGVDGSGKSSSIEYLKNNNCIKNHGVRTIYFGNNNYWIPFLNQILKISKKPKILVWIVYVLTSFDRRMRVLKVIFLKRFGFIILGDRYFFDDVIGYRKGKQTESKLKNFFKNLIRIRKFYNPDLVIFMDVSSSVGYKRKQDYPYEIMIDNVKSYRDFFYRKHLKNLIIIDCDREEKIVKQDVLNIVNKHIEQRNNKKIP